MSMRRIRSVAEQHSFDERCRSLADYFLADCNPNAVGPSTRNRLAARIQEAVETFLQENGIQ